MTESIKPMICLEEGIVALLLEVDRQILPKVVGARYGSIAPVWRCPSHVRFTPS